MKEIRKKVQSPNVSLVNTHFLTEGQCFASIVKGTPGPRLPNEEPLPHS